MGSGLYQDDSAWPVEVQSERASLLGDQLLNELVAEQLVEQIAAQAGLDLVGGSLSQQLERGQHRCVLDRRLVHVVRRPAKGGDDPGQRLAFDHGRCRHQMGIARFFDDRVGNPYLPRWAPVDPRAGRAHGKDPVVRRDDRHLATAERRERGCDRRKPSVLHHRGGQSLMGQQHSL